MHPRGVPLPSIAWGEGAQTVEHRVGQHRSIGSDQAKVWLRAERVVRIACFGVLNCGFRPPNVLSNGDCVHQSFNFSTRPAVNYLLPLHFYLFAFRVGPHQKLTVRRQTCPDS
jgi:hypothetical protein